MKPITGMPPVLDKASGSHNLTGWEITTVEPYVESIMMACLNYACLFMLQSIAIGLLGFPLREGDGMISPSDLSLLNLVSAMRSPLEG